MITQDITLREALACRTNHTIMDLNGRICIFVENHEHGWLFQVVENQAKLIRHHSKVMNRITGEQLDLKVKE